MKVLCGLAVLLILSGECHGQVEWREATVGERVTLTCRDTYYLVEWFGTKGSTTDQLYSNLNGNVTITYPDKHEGFFDGDVENSLIIISAEMEDAMTYRCIGRYIRATVYLEVYPKDNSELRNQVWRYSARLHLAYNMDMDEESSVQWTLQEQRSSSVQDIYFRKLEGGGVLPYDTFLFNESSLGYGVFTDSLSSLTVGKYKYFALNPPDIQEKEFSVTGTTSLQCDPTAYIIEGQTHNQSCSAVFSVGNLVPVFTWFRDGQVVDGQVIVDPTYSPLGSRWIYQHTFEAEYDTPDKTFTCNIRFKHEGPISAFEDTSDPTYSESCNVTYSEVEYAVRNTRITPSSQNAVLILKVGQILSCSADGYPEASYEWHCTGFNETGQDLRISKEFFDNNITDCRCVASNRLSNWVTYTDSNEVKFRVAHESSILTPPKNLVVVVVGESVKLDCTLAPFINGSANNTEDWDYQWAAFFFNNEDTKNIIYHASKDRSGVLTKWQDNFEEGGTKHDLVMNNANYDLAGRYSCQVINYPLAGTWQGQVFVVESVRCIGPKKRINQDEAMNLVCQLQYGGSIEPEMEWYADNTLLQGTSSNLLSTKQSKMKEISIKVQAKAGVKYRCAVTLRSGSELAYTDECSI